MDAKCLVRTQWMKESVFTLTDSVPLLFIVTQPKVAGISCACFERTIG